MKQIDRRSLRRPCLVLELQPGDTKEFAVEDIATIFAVVRPLGENPSLVLLDVSNREVIAASEILAFAEAVHEPAPFPPQGLSVSIDVVVCTRDRPTTLARTIESLRRQDDYNFSLIVVDNSVAGDLDRSIIVNLPFPAQIFHQPRPGLSNARNLGLDNAASEVVAWLDDDEMAASDWITSIKRAFASSAVPDAVTGAMLPAELETDAQIEFERYGGFNKGRGLNPQVLIAGKNRTVRDPFYPLPNFGAGGNMAFRKTILNSIGGFDPFLGAGTLSGGAEDTKALSAVLAMGGVILYEPKVVTWHTHRRTMSELKRQFFANTAGLTAFYMSLLVSSPRLAYRVARIVPRGIADLLMPQRATARSESPLPDNFPIALLREARRGLLAGPLLYLKERWAQSTSETRANRAQKRFLF